MPYAHTLPVNVRLVTIDNGLVETLIERAPFIFPRLTTPDEIRDVVMRLISFAQIRLLQMPVRYDLREMASQALRDIGCCVRGEDRDHTTGMTALRLVETVLTHGGEEDLAEAIGCGVRTLCQRMKAN